MLWKPSTSIERLQQRAAIVTQIRQFFADRGVWEVDTPVLSAAAVTDVHLHSFVTRFIGPGRSKGQQLYMTTSPEFHMKRLLAAGSGAIYQFARAFRNEEAGRFHNPEFTLLEWYRPGFDHHQLMAEMDALLQQVLACPPAEYKTYQQAMQDYAHLDPLTATEAQLTAALPAELASLTADELDRDTLLQLLFSYVVEPHIGQQQPTFIYNFPASQAALSKISEADPRVAERFEVYFGGVELANGFHELTDADEQRRRFEADNEQRLQRGQPVMPIDENLLLALQHGLPDCAGVALGIDRLIMLACGAKRIEQVMAFALERA